MKRPIMTERETKKSYWLLVALGVSGLAMVALMLMLGRRALHMPEDAKTLNRLLRARTLACAEGGDPAQCEKASLALEEFRKEREGKRPLSPRH